MYLPGTIATPSLDRRQHEVGLLLDHVGPVGLDRFERLVRHRNHHAARARARDERDRLHDAEVSVVVAVRVAVRVLRRAAGRFRASAQIVVSIIPHSPDGIASPCDIPCVPILGDRRKRFAEAWRYDFGSNSTARDAMPRDDVCCLERGRRLYVDGPTRFFEGRDRNDPARVGPRHAGRSRWEYWGLDGVTRAATRTWERPTFSSWPTSMSGRDSRATHSSHREIRRFRLQRKKPDPS